MTDEHYMNMALQLARQARGQVSPNPLVGAVLVKEGKIIGTGAHLRAGGAHAEVHALRAAGDACGATMYVTLEPCSHFGRTPPCSDALIQHQVKRVVIACTDPNPEVAGRGIEKLNEAGIDVTLGVLEDEARELNRIFFHHIRYQRPFITLKFAASLDGKIATSEGESQWITSSHARYDGWKERHDHDGIVVGIGTILADDPSLTARIPGGRHPERIILDTHLQLPLDAKVVIDQMAPTWVITSEEAPIAREKALKNRGVRVIRSHPRKLHDWLHILWQHHICSVYVEGGSEVLASFLQEKQFQRVVAYFAPTLIGGANAPSAFGGRGIPSLSETPALSVHSVDTLGSDIKVVLYRGGV
ncbi:bifunctional diaminohydroxyphosphoribosylaminopyrimidine deaminase/5-amino-6-(5-phosphoribosylamino)uracil reductase RibD [Bacillaceae bacterium SIJ1]|uniref:bifunctional diaminohydroxyphosphoribosylaminopyrimidine deaminase/5-amino-6-(5-phosphoribosylamino)uracil reductase RibD n=1 Tax=Litoribacterium kuwaitense TaxID=1398745 RepID=UPI0013EBF28E|nr:bifunctional diaminohydroxyphosphoribosylaminopyrimidine deaminase/5-amino-6-(5-phosphoribosylamino)uracil reductase RibD [Litoribacterium kuwaitense]NGP43656.1 bifunctional diaminohydroxyphosphoribosylaminopyrimidine deaminase/5-amino-6-(5-phosphoribosylamino)uracil reductase RibD [Litoribacterium kuwaitense]